VISLTKKKGGLIMNPIKRILVFIIALILVFSTSVSAISNEAVSKVDLSNESLIEIVDPHIIENNLVYEIINEKGIINKIGEKSVQSLKDHLILASIEKNENSTKNAVNYIHILILENIGATVTKHWWGTRILTPSKSVAINVSNLASLFSTEISDKAMLTGLLLAGVGTIPGAGTPAVIAAVLVGLFGWADARTWATVSSLMSSQFVYNKYLLTVDINKWIMEVKVYPQ
jgi:hypothetical protein